MKPSWMTYGVLKDLPRSDLLGLLRANGFVGVEFRTDANQGHGVEASLDEAGRRQVVAECEAAGIPIISVATGNRYHDTDAAELRRHIDETRERIDLAVDLGAPRVRVFGNNFPDNVSRDDTIAQVTEALEELCEYGKTRGVRPCLELHGEFDWRAGVKVAGGIGSDNFGLIWNSVHQDVVDGSIGMAMNSVWPWLDHVHLHDLAGEGYPYRQLFAELHQRGYEGYMSAEAERGSDNPPGDLPMFVAYYAELFSAFADLARAGAI